MKQEIEIKRKVFEIISEIGEHSKKVTRKNKIYFLKDYSSLEEFDLILKANHTCSVNGINVPKIYMYDKNRKIIVFEFIEFKNCFDMLMESDLPQEIFEQAFIMNRRCINNKISIEFLPINFAYNGNKLYYLSSFLKPFNEKYNLEKQSIYMWFYTVDFTKYISTKGYEIDLKRSRISEGEKNKAISLMVIKYFR